MGSKDGAAAISRVLRPLVTAGICLGACLLSACGGGGSSPTAAPRYTVGGTLSGLAASGLVLLDDGGDALDVAATATTFEFSEPLANAAAYDVSVQSQPSGESCSVNDASGTVQGADVSSIGVSCQPLTYSIGGSIQGDTQAGLVLLDNGGDALNVPANATSFTFGTQLTAGSPYRVTVQTSPGGETCTPNGGSGTVSGNVTNISIQCSLLSYSIGGSISGDTQSGLVLLDNGGDALAAPAGATGFTFDTQLAAGSTYDVTVQTPPSGESCQVGNAQGPADASITSVTIGCTSNYASGTAANVVPISVAPGPADANHQTFNIPLVTVKVCEPGTTTCATIPDVLVDTGSSGLRLLSSSLPNGFVLPAIQDGSGNNVFECLPFADGYSWGGVALATVTVGSETTTPTSGVPVQIIDSSANPAALPSSCSSFGGTPDSSVDSFDANGILGVGLFAQDCGQNCVTDQDNRIYYGCPAGGCTTLTQSETVSLADQVLNPVASFPKDNNGVIVQLPVIPASGSAGASGYLVFGIGTESAGATEADNHLNGATVLGVSEIGQFSTTFEGMQLPYSFIDSGSNSLYLPQPTPSLAACGTSGAAARFYCPASTTTFSAINQGENAGGTATGSTSNVSFQIADLNAISDADFAIDDAGASANAIDIGPNGTATSSYFDWGLPFFYGRTVFTAIEGMQADGTTGPYFAY